MLSIQVLWHIIWDEVSVTRERTVGHKLNSFEVLRMISRGKFDFKYRYVFLLWYNWNKLW